MKCENCGQEHDGSYGSRRFCSSTCARGFSTKEKRKEINKKVSKKLRKDGLTLEQKRQKKNKEKHASYVRETEVTSIMDLSKRTVMKILRRMELPCFFCGWYVVNVSCDVHHIVEKKKGGTDEMSNLTYLCPNCHRLVHSGVLKFDKLVNMQDYIGDSWKKFYYVKNGKIITGSVPAG